MRYKGDQILYQTTISHLAEVAQGVFYPTKALVEYNNYPIGTGRMRGIFQASSVVANDPSFDPSVFTLKWPASIPFVENEVTHKVERVSKN